MKQKPRSERSFNKQTIGPFQVLRRLGKGGMGTVYLAEHTEGKVIVALKKYPANSKDYQPIWCLHESRVLKYLEAHDVVGVPGFYESSVLSDTPYLAMEYVEGKTLSELMRDGPIPVPTAIEYIEKILYVLRQLHAVECIHRDLKPSNIMITNESEVFLLDFGLCHVHSMPPIEEGDDQVGTPRYMSPNQAKSGLPRPSDDLHSLGVIFHEMVFSSVPSPTCRERPGGCTHGKNRLSVQDMKNVSRVLLGLHDEQGDTQSALQRGLYSQSAALPCWAVVWRSIIKSLAY